MGGSVMRHELTSMKTPWNVGWPTVITTLCVPVLSTQYFPDLPKLLDPAPTLEQQLLILAGSTVAVYFWYEFLTTTIPWFVLNLKMRRSHARGDWEAFVRVVRALETRGSGSDELTAALGEAFGHLDQHADAVAAFERIDLALEDPIREMARIYNFSYSLACAGRVDDARSMFDSVEFAKWPKEMFLHVGEFRSYLRGETSTLGPMQ